MDRTSAPGWRAVAVALVLLAVLAVASTARVFSATMDEPAHLAAGIEWLTTGHYTYDLPHPPLGRIALSLAPYVHGAQTTGQKELYTEGGAILGAGDHYVDTLASARHGMLVFLIVLCGAVWAWGRQQLGEAGAAVALLFAVTNPTTLAHAGLATTDIACAAMTVLALYAALRWAQDPSTGNALFAGLAVGGAVGSRISALAFVAGPLGIMYLIRGWAERRWSFGEVQARRVFGQVAMAIGASALVILALYRFDAAPFVEGVRQFVAHGNRGHYTYLLGTPGFNGWWYYFPVALAVKTPFPLIMLSAIGAWVAMRALVTKRDWAASMPLIAAATILAISLRVRVDLGVRLVLPIYPLLAIVAAQGVMALWQMRRAVAGRALAIALSAASVLIVVRAHPDHLAYFNPLAGPHPERVLVDSNLDWGQDLYRLRDTIQARGIRDSVYVAYFGTTSPSAAGVPRSRFLNPNERPHGWVAAGETFLVGEWMPGAYGWLRQYPPVARIGRGMWLWKIP